MAWLVLLLQLGVSLPAPVNPAEAAYQAQRERRLDDAVAAFRLAIERAPANAHLRIDYAYALLKTGEREAARDQIATALQLDPADERRALEYGFLCYETRRPAEARRVFARLQGSPDAALAAAATRAYEAVDQPLAANIARWQEAIRRAPGLWSAHGELARWAEQRDDARLAAEHFAEVWRLRPDYKDTLIDLGRAWRQSGEPAKSRLALVAAWRSGSSRVREQAREMLGGEPPAEGEIALVAGPGSGDPVAAGDDFVFSPIEMGERSLQQSFLADALRYYTLAQQQDPANAQLLLKLATVANLLHRDSEALAWFDRAQRSGDAGVAAQARQSYAALRRSLQRFGLSAWTLPFYSSRWNDTFVYSQLRGEYRPKGKPVTLYLSLRWVGDLSGAQRRFGWSSLPVYLSETNVILGAGLGVKLPRGVYGWAEAGEATSYVGRRRDTGLAHPDYRGGLSWSKGFGRPLGGEAGWFVETSLDGVYVSAFQQDMLGYWQNRAGYTLAPSAAGFQAQALVHFNLMADRKGESWGNFVETGPGVRFRFAHLPRGLTLRAESVRGAYLINAGNPRRPNYWDTRLGLWYAITR